jgi:hypothetical protein
MQIKRREGKRKLTYTHTCKDGLEEVWASILQFI